MSLLSKMNETRNYSETVSESGDYKYIYIPDTGSRDKALKIAKDILSDLGIKPAKEMEFEVNFVADSKDDITSFTSDKGINIAYFGKDSIGDSYGIRINTVFANKNKIASVAKKRKLDMLK